VLTAWAHAGRALAPVENIKFGFILVCCMEESGVERAGGEVK